MKMIEEMNDIERDGGDVMGAWDQKIIFSFPKKFTGIS